MFLVRVNEGKTSKRTEMTEGQVLEAFSGKEGEEIVKAFLASQKSTTLACHAESLMTGFSIARL